MRGLIYSELASLFIFGKYEEKASLLNRSVHCDADVTEKFTSSPANCLFQRPSNYSLDEEGCSIKC